MASWHECHRVKGSLSRYAENSLARQIVQRCEQDDTLFEAFYIRQQNIGLHPPVEECIQLWPIPPILAPTAQEARDRALLLLEVAASGTQDNLFEQRPCPMPIHRKKVAEVASPTHIAKACIFKHTEARYEVRYFGDWIGCDFESGWRLRIPAGEGEVVPEGFEVLTFADDLSSAEKMAVLELERIVAEKDIKPR